MEFVEYQLSKSWIERDRPVMLRDDWIPLNFVPSTRDPREGYLYYLVPRTVHQ